MISTTADHALRAVLYLARRDDDGPVPADRIAAALGAPANYLAKTLQVLSREGIVEGIRGPGGGHRLVRDARTLSLAEVIDPFDETRRREVCLLGDRPCDDRDPCDAHRCWTAIVRHAQGTLERVTVADLLAGVEPVWTGPALETLSAARRGPVPEVNPFL